MAQTLTRSVTSTVTRHVSLILLQKRLVSTDFAVGASRAITRPSGPPSWRVGSNCCRVDSAGCGATYSPLNSSGGSGGNFRGNEMVPLFLGCDYQHWIIFMYKTWVDESASDQKMFEFYVWTLAKVLGSNEEAKNKIYDFSCETYCFACEVDEETSKKLEGLPGVLGVLPDYKKAKYRMNKFERIGIFLKIGCSYYLLCFVVTNLVCVF